MNGLFRTVQQATDQAAYFINEMGYTVISEPNDVAYFLMAKVDREYVHLLEITKDNEKPTAILMDKAEFEAIGKMLKIK